MVGTVGAAMAVTIVGVVITAGAEVILTSIVRQLGVIITSTTLPMFTQTTTQQLSLMVLAD
jgi:hypothetical protein